MILVFFFLLMLRGYLIGIVPTNSSTIVVLSASVKRVGVSRLQDLFNHFLKTIVCQVLSERHTLVLSFTLPPFTNCSYCENSWAIYLYQIAPARIRCVSDLDIQCKNLKLPKLRRQKKGADGFPAKCWVCVAVKG